MQNSHFKGRKSLRINTDLKVTFRTQNGDDTALHQERVIDLSRTGLFIKTAMIYPIETELVIQLFLDDEDNPLQFTGTVCRVIADSAGEFSGLGIKLNQLGAAEQDRFENYLSLQHNYGWFC